ncbi:MAG: hypothetical protein ACKPBG_14650, partial [Actinomycetota bacterium]
DPKSMASNRDRRYARYPLVPSLMAMDFGSVRAEGYGFQIEMTHRAVRRGARIIEVPIRFKDRIAGESKLTHHIIGEAFALVVRLWFRDRVLKKLARST